MPENQEVVDDDEDEERADVEGFISKAAIQNRHGI
jgi:hypothetical protein